MAVKILLMFYVVDQNVSVFLILLKLHRETWGVTDVYWRIYG